MRPNSGLTSALAKSFSSLTVYNFTIKSADSEILTVPNYASSFFTRWHVPPSHTSAEVCLTGWPNAQPQGWDKCSVARHHQACLTAC